MSTTIEWTEETWNPATGCTKISPGCKHCYAEGVAERFFAKQYPPNADGSPRKFTDVRVHPDRLEEPLRRRKPTMYFVNSMSDLFHEFIDPHFIAKVFAQMAVTPQHTYQILTKRPTQMLNLLGKSAFADLVQNYRWRDEVSFQWPLPNVWLGVSVESQKYADERIPLLVQTPAAVRFLSVEPMLESVMLPRRVFLPHGVCGDFPFGHTTRIGGGNHVAFPNPHGALSVRAEDGKLLGIKPDEFKDLGLGVDWVICGGESGSAARPFQLGWAENLRLQCLAADTAFFFKQCGSNPRSFSGVPFTPKDSKGGDLSEVPERLRVRQFPKGKAVGA
jgi:protein gp37